jgi:hypothetical protein
MSALFELIRGVTFDASFFKTTLVLGTTAPVLSVIVALMDQLENWASR